MNPLEFVMKQDHEGMSNQLKAANTRIKDLEAQVNAYREYVLGLPSASTEQVPSNADKEDELSTKSAQIAYLSAQLAEANGRLESASETQSEDLSKANNHIHELKSIVKGKDARIAELEARLVTAEDKSKRIDELESALDDAHKKIKELSESNARLAANPADIENHPLFIQLREQNDDLKDQLERAQHTILALQIRANKAEAESERLSQALARCQQQLTGLAKMFNDKFSIDSTEEPAKPDASTGTVDTEASNSTEVEAGDSNEELTESDDTTEEPSEDEPEDSEEVEASDSMTDSAAEAGFELDDDDDFFDSLDSDDEDSAESDSEEDDSDTESTGTPLPDDPLGIYLS